VVSEVTEVSEVSEVTGVTEVSEVIEVFDTLDDSLYKRSKRVCSGLYGVFYECMCDTWQCPGGHCGKKR